MRVGNNKRTDYGAISKRSIARDFYREEIHLPRKKVANTADSQKIAVQSPDPGCVKRIAFISQNCEYVRYSKYFVGKLMRLEERTGPGNSTTGWYSFVHDEDSQALNHAAGWTSKRRYLLQAPKFK